MQKLILGIVAMFFGCQNSPQGYYEQGLYIPTHITACVSFCANRGKVFTLIRTGEREDLCECRCRDASTIQLPYRPERKQ